MESIFAFDLQKTLSLKSRQRLFVGKTFFLTPNLRPKVGVLSNVIEWSGGKVEIGRRKSLSEIKQINQGGNLNYIVVTCDEDVGQVEDMIDANLSIFSSEFVLSSVMRCEMDFTLACTKYV